MINLHPVMQDDSKLFADVILPLSVAGRYTYLIPDRLRNLVKPGSGVIVSFGNRRLYSGIVISVHSDDPATGKTKEIVEVSEEMPVINEIQLRLWSWISDYYMCTHGEVMRAAMPSAMVLQSETVIYPDFEFNRINDLSSDESWIYNLVSNKGKATIKSLPSEISGNKTLKIVRDLLRKGALISDEDIGRGYKRKKETFLVLSKKYSDSELNLIIDKLGKAPVQQKILLHYLELTGYSQGSDLFPVKKSVLLRATQSGMSQLNGLLRKGIMIQLSLDPDQSPSEGEAVIAPKELSQAQGKALSRIRELFIERDIVLLHGITSSGKTEIYFHLIDEMLKKGKQVLYLLPEIALTSQIIERLKRHFGPYTAVYHSRISERERAETWYRASSVDSRVKLVLGARSALFLPYHNLGLVIVDEEHDTSYKQADPDPRYNARDSAIMLSSFAGAKTLLGSATPSVETYYNSISNKYGLVELNERFGSINLPDIILANSREASRKKLMVSHFTPQLLNAIDNALSNKEQAILFRNRRGFSPYIECSECGWIPVCNSCSVNLTWHKDINRLVCHYCGSSVAVPHKCNNCGSVAMNSVGYGTEKLEDEIKIIFPKAVVARMDQDTTKTKSSFNKILRSFETGETDILIGTQMISKGLDFENLTVVGILNADSMLNFPDFRAYERAFQLMAQVSGRAGRRKKHGKVVIQTANPDSRLIRQVVNHDYRGMFESQLEERKLFSYPPFTRLVKIVLKHKDREKLNHLSSVLADELRKAFGKRVLGPEFPVIQRIQLWYLKNILIKIERNKPVTKAKEFIAAAVSTTQKQPGAGSLRIEIDVDPM